MYTMDFELEIGLLKEIDLKLILTKCFISLCKLTIGNRNLIDIDQTLNYQHYITVLLNLNLFKISLSLCIQ